MQASTEKSTVSLSQAERLLTDETPPKKKRKVSSQVSPQATKKIIVSKKPTAKAFTSVRRNGSYTEVDKRVLKPGSENLAGKFGYII